MPMNVPKSPEFTGIGPATYEREDKFGDNVPTFKIAEKRDVAIKDGPGPGYYEPLDE